jgi:hypothetical protein
MAMTIITPQRFGCCFSRASKHMMLFILVAGVTLAAEPVVGRSATLWRGDADLDSRDLLFGPGGRNGMPAAGPFEFVKESKGGSNAKFLGRDSQGTMWQIKVGQEAKPETVAARIVWAAGYAADEDYYLERVPLANVPNDLSERLQRYITSDSILKGGRFERLRTGDKGEFKHWSWKDNQFEGTREYNGLRALMALINNWDLKDVNNTIYVDAHSGEQVYALSDLGATFGATTLAAGKEHSRGHLKTYEKSKFIIKKTPEYVDFATPGAPSVFEVFNLPMFITRIKMRSIGRGVSRADARWLGTVLARLSPKQIRDAFRSGGYTEEEVERFARVIETRISELNAL